MPQISVIVPFFNGSTLLRQCLAALERQNLPRGDFEVIAIDNGSTEDVAAVRREFPAVRWLSEPRPGSARARNLGLAHATGEIIAFTDADCLPAPTWLEELVRALETTGKSMIAGRIAYPDPGARSLNSCELIEAHFFLLDRQKYLAEKLGVAATANLAVRRRVVDRTGGFDAELFSYEDGDLTQRAIGLGETLGYADNALVVHPRRRAFRGIFKKARRMAGGKIVLLRKQRAKPAVFLRDLFRYCPLSPMVHRTALNFPNARGLGQRLQLFGLVEFLCFAATCERLLVLCGARPFRG